VAARREVAHAAQEPSYRRQPKELRRPTCGQDQAANAPVRTAPTSEPSGPASAITNVDRASAPRPSERKARDIASTRDRAEAQAKPPDTHSQDRIAVAGTAFGPVACGGRVLSPDTASDSASSV
jgi:hypothetical protein